MKTFGIINRTKHGKIFSCSACNKIHIEFNNLNFSFTEYEYNYFRNFIKNIDELYWENKNQHTPYTRKIIVPIDHNSVSTIFSCEEIRELRILLRINTADKEQLSPMKLNSITENLHMN